MQQTLLLTTPQFEPVLSLKQAAEALKLHPDTLKKMARRGEVPAMKVGKYWRFRLSELDCWIRSKVVSPQPQPRRVN